MATNADSLNIAASLKILDGSHLGANEPSMDERLKTVAADVATIKAIVEKLSGGLNVSLTGSVTPKA